MRFTRRKSRQAPAVIIVSLIDVLIVLLIFLVVTTTFKQQPAVRLALPESTQAEAGSSEAAMIVTIARTEPYLYLGRLPVTFDRLQQEFTAGAARNPAMHLSIRADTEAPWGQIVKVMDTAKEAGIRSVSAYTKAGVTP